MLFLVFFELISLLGNYFKLPVKIFFYYFIFLYLAFKRSIFLIDAYFFLLNAVFAIIYFAVAFQDFFIVFGFKLYKFFFGF